MRARSRQRSVLLRAALVLLVASVSLAVSGCSETRTSSSVGSASSDPASAAPSRSGPALAIPIARVSKAKAKKTAKPAPKATSAATKQHPHAGQAVTTLATVLVRGRGPMTGYSRDRFGPAWLDVNRNGCDTRNDILRAQLTRVGLRTGTRGCVVESGRLLDPYTGVVMQFRRGPGDKVQIDHVVALGDAWVSGAVRWPIARRAAFAEDPENLLAVDSTTNGQKGDSDAASWLPPNHPERCAYVARQVAVKAKYGLSMTRAEAEAIRRVLSACPGQRLPRPSGQPTTTDLHVTDPGAPGAVPPKLRTIV